MLCLRRIIILLLGSNLVQLFRQQKEIYDISNNLHFIMFKNRAEKLQTYVLSLNKNHLKYYLVSSKQKLFIYISLTRQLQRQKVQCVSAHQTFSLSHAFSRTALEISPTTCKLYAITLPNRQKSYLEEKGLLNNHSLTGNRHTS